MKLFKTKLWVIIIAQGFLFLLLFSCKSSYKVENWISDQNYLDSAKYYFYKDDFENAKLFFYKSVNYPLDNLSSLAVCEYQTKNFKEAKILFKMSSKKETNIRLYADLVDSLFIDGIAEKTYDTKESVELKCTLLKMLINDQTARNSNFKLNRYVKMRNPICDLSLYGHYERESVDSINLFKLDSLVKVDMYPIISKINDQEILGIALILIIHQSSDVNDFYIKYFGSLVTKKEIPYYQFFTIIGNRIKRFSTEGCTKIDLLNYVSKSTEYNNTLLSFIKSAHLILKDNPQYRGTILISDKYKKTVENFLKSTIKDEKFSAIVKYDYKDQPTIIEFCFKK